MAKFYGTIGYAETVETKPGVHKEQIIEKQYFGDLLRISRQLQSTDKVNDDVKVAHEISIVADPYANQHFHAMRYVEFSGAKWKITNVQVQYPRLILSVGGLYNG